MKILIADAKSLQVKQNNIQGQNILFAKQAKYLLDKLKKLDVNDIHDLMKISFKQSSLIYDYFHNDEYYPAISLYNGVVYKQLELSKYSEVEFDYLDKHLLIMSPLYGLVRYDDLISFHRLEMNHHIDNINLYQYWDKSINDYLKDEEIISLGTKEYEKLVSHPIIKIDFGIVVAGQIKRNAIYLKQARGKMLNEMIKKNITKIDDIKKMNIDGYIFHEELSSSENLVFLKDGLLKHKRL